MNIYTCFVGLLDENSRCCIGLLLITIYSLQPSTYRSPVQMLQYSPLLCSIEKCFPWPYIYIIYSRTEQIAKSGFNPRSIQNSVFPICLTGNNVF